MNKILFNFLIVGVSLTSIQAASAGKPGKDSLGGEEINSAPLKPVKITKPGTLGLKAAHTTCSRVRYLQLQPIPMRAFSGNKLMVSDRSAAFGLKPQNSTVSHVRLLQLEPMPMRSLSDHALEISQRRITCDLKVQHQTLSRVTFLDIKPIPMRSLSDSVSQGESALPWNLDATSPGNLRAHVYQADLTEEDCLEAMTENSGKLLSYSLQENVPHIILTSYK